MEVRMEPRLERRWIPAKAGIHAFCPVTKHRNENAADGNNP
jgi:hypothetical protein